MKITIFTSNQARHLHLINRLAEIADSTYAVIEANTVFPGKIKDFFNNSNSFRTYFTQVLVAESKLFGSVNFLDSRINTLILKSGDLNLIERNILKDAMDADVFVVFGSSFIKGWLIEELVAKNAINIHMGVSPYYRGSSCNFWALYDNNPHLVGATIHRLSRGLDSGDMYYHALPTTSDCSSPFEFSMRAVKAAHISLVQRIASAYFVNASTTPQNAERQIRYTKNADFTNAVIENYLARNDAIESVEHLLNERMDRSLYLDPFYY